MQIQQAAAKLHRILATAGATTRRSSFAYEPSSPEFIQGASIGLVTGGRFTEGQRRRPHAPGETESKDNESVQQDARRQKMHRGLGSFIEHFKHGNYDEDGVRATRDRTEYERIMLYDEDGEEVPPPPPIEPPAPPAASRQFKLTSETKVKASASAKVGAKREKEVQRAADGLGADGVDVDANAGKKKEEGNGITSTKMTMPTSTEDRLSAIFVLYGDKDGNSSRMTSAGYHRFVRDLRVLNNVFGYGDMQQQFALTVKASKHSKKVSIPRASRSLS